MADILSASELKDDIKFGLSGAYVFFGEEEYMKHYYLTEVRKKVLGDDPDGIYRHKKISCFDFDAEKIIDACSTAPLGFFSEGKTLVELHEIQFPSLKEAEWKVLCRTLEDISEDVVCVLYISTGEMDIGTLPKSPSKPLLRLIENAKGIYFPQEGEMRLYKWAAKHFVSEKLSYENGVCELIVQYCGKDMFALSGELEKLIAFVKSEERTQVTQADVQRVCCRNTEIRAFDFSNALLSQNTDRSLEILADMKLKKEQPVIVLASVLKEITNMYTVRTLSDCGYNESEIAKRTKIHEYRVGIYKKAAFKRSTARIQNLLNVCTETDVKLKSSSLDSYTELYKLVILASSK